MRFHMNFVVPFPSEDFRTNFAIEHFRLEREKRENGEKLTCKTGITLFSPISYCESFHTFHTKCARIISDFVEIFLVGYQKNRPIFFCFVEIVEIVEIKAKTKRR